ncbi:FRG domain-containing protein [Poriferisphaera sp. WC338]|uniref:FRG domain-containing protein n=1 Tax=Poriferisphaera sp. WC338 TaxID=3425129 RepID=UPI003D81322E
MFYEYKITNWDDFYYLNDLLNHKYVFRGQADASWPLSTKIERVAKQFEQVEIPHLEWFILDDFRRQAHQYLNHLPEKENRVDWLALIQHYGGPTRLLDFTKSLAIALFFAIENTTTEAAVYAVSCNPLFKNLDSKGAPQDKDGATHQYMRAHKIINKLPRFDYGANEGILPVEPDFLCDRQSLQQGVFLYPEISILSFERNLCTELGLDTDRFPNFELLTDRRFFQKLELPYENPLIKFTVPNNADLRTQLMAKLYSMGIDARSLFPGIDGLARSFIFSGRYYSSIQSGLQNPPFSARSEESLINTQQ